MENNNQINFSLKGFASVIIGALIFAAGYLVEILLKNSTIKNLDFLIPSIAFILFLFSSFTLFFIGKVNAKKENYKLWNNATKTACKKYFSGMIIIFMTAILLVDFNFFNYITPTSLTLYGLLLFLLKNKERKNFLMLVGLSLFLAVICFLIPSYWAASISILGIAHVTYGVVVKE